MTRTRPVGVATAVVAALLLGCPLTAGAGATKSVIRIDVNGAPQGGNPSGGGGRFTLRNGSLTDKGIDSYSLSSGKGTITLTGKRGTLMLATKSTRSGLHVDSEGLDIWTGTWSVVDGDGAYEGVHAIGAYVGIIGPSYRVALHLEGFRSAS
jgi:hypothetical protein